MFSFRVRLEMLANFRTASLALSFVLISSVIANGQGGVGSSRGLPESAGGSHRIQGTIYLPDGRRAGAGIVIKLDGNVTGTRRTATDASGEFSFNSLPAADYSLTLDAGPDYEPLRQSVLIYGNTGNVGLGATGDTTKVDAQLRPKAVSDAILFAGVPKEAVALYKSGVASGQAGNSKKAVEQLNGALSLHPNFALALRAIGVQYSKLKDMEKLAQTMEALLKVDPQDPYGHLNLGIALYSQRKLPEAETQLREAVKLANTDPRAHLYLGLTLISRDHVEAQKELELAISNGGENIALAHRYLGGLYMASKDSRAADELEKYLKLEPKAADADKIKGIIKDLRDKKQ